MTRNSLHFGEWGSGAGSGAGSSWKGEGGAGLFDEAVGQQAADDVSIEVRCGSRTVVERLQYLATGLATASFEAGLLTAHTSRTNGRIRIGMPSGAPCTTRYKWTLGACRGWPAKPGAKVHDDLVPRPSIAERHSCIGTLLCGFERQPLPCRARQNSRDVGVHYRDIPFERKGQDRTRRVRADSRKGEQIFESVRKRPIVVFDNERCGGMQIAGTPRVAEPLPKPQNLAQRRCSALSRCRKGIEKGDPLRNDSFDLRLLQHHLGDQDAPRVTLVTPRQVAHSGEPPRQHSTGIDRRAVHPAVGTQNATVRYGCTTDSTPAPSSASIDSRVRVKTARHCSGGNELT